jgi:DNA primase
LEKFCKSGATADLDIDMEEFEKRKFTSNMNRIFAPVVPEVTLKIPREQVVQSLSIPDKYFMSRGFSKEVLTKYDVGLCTAKGKQMYMRATAPIYDEDHSYVVGCTGRSIYETCPLCQSHHSPIEGCPDEYNLWKYTKWRHSDGFKGEHHLYNYWFAKEHIAKSGIAIIVESPGNIWRLEESGFHNAVATFGAHLTDGQRTILDKSGALSLIVLTDPDTAGRLANERIQKECGNTYSLYFPTWNNGDIGDTPIAQVAERLTPIVNQAKKDLGI